MKTVCTRMHFSPSTLPNQQGLYVYIYMSRFLDSGWMSGKGPSPESGQALPEGSGSGTEMPEFTEYLDNSLSVIWSDFWVDLRTQNSLNDL